jgi:N-acetylmuramoyl-L-alanine amidase
MPENHIVNQGECLSSIAAQYGFRDYRTIYEDALNADFRRLRPDPNLIYPGDTVVIPDKQQRTESCSTEKKHRFVLNRSLRKLRLRMLDSEGNAIANAAYVLTCDGVDISGQTDGNGVLLHTIPADTAEAVLNLHDRVWQLQVASLNPMENTGDDGVSGCQARLRNLGYDPGPIDGIAGPRTEAAVRAFQRDYSLTVDGICGPQTRGKLKEVYGT